MSDNSQAATGSAHSAMNAGILEWIKDVETKHAQSEEAGEAGFTNVKSQQTPLSEENRRGKDTVAEAWTDSTDFGPPSDQDGQSVESYVYASTAQHLAELFHKGKGGQKLRNASGRISLATRMSTDARLLSTQIDPSQITRLSIFTDGGPGYSIISAKIAWGRTDEKTLSWGWGKWMGTDWEELPAEEG